jgi:glycosyltransferase involved in cell wall biosynthesis
MKKRRLQLFVDGDVLVHPHFSGIGHYTADLLRAVDELLYQEEYSHVSVTIGVPYRLKHKLIKYGFANLGVQGLPFPARVVNGLKQRGRLPPIEFFAGRQVYLFPNYSSWPTMFGRSIPIIYDLSFVKYKEFVEPQNQAFLVDQVQKSVKRARRIVTISHNSRQEIVENYGYDADNVSLVFPAVDIRKFYPRSQKEIDFIKAKYGIFEDYILFVGNIEPRKNLITLLKAYNNLPKELQKNTACY